MRVTIMLACFFFLAGCKKDPVLTDAMLGGETIFDPSVYDPGKYLVSLAKPNPTPSEASTPVIITVHGYSASTFEWDEFRSFASGRSNVLISQVLMGGHGVSYADFKNASWQDWKQPVLEEYMRLEKAGYTNISLAGSSTGSAVILNMLADGFFIEHTKPRQIFLIDPIVIPADKSLSLIGIAGPIIGYTEADNTAEEDKHWYHYRPYETLKELKELTGLVRHDLQKGFRLPAGTQLKVYKSKKDTTADPVSAVLIYKGLKSADAQPVEVEMIDSELHVFTRLDLRPNLMPKDRDNQKNAFEDILSRLN
ncbi:alpha/beta hydrolase [Dyadobacter sandarakinus]|uniref:Esterase n=1 Tax=Dyadobacter sandarakinus TaxID=2747268 RepID=A0ABX7I2R2_9BACT|nr:esterase [Dyadobacter sandarakinus]QRR00173.1 esterase [Dyadobacter sandarakinus]